MTTFEPEKMNISQLEELIKYHNQLYWDANAPEISDADYDRLLEALKKLAPNHELVNAVHSVTVESSGKVRHTEPMLSLDKAYSLEALLEWANKYARSPGELLLVEPKYDGISAGFDGKILSTRGDGETGENISGKLPLIELEAPGYTGKVDRPARGEIIIRNDDFKNLYSTIRKKGGGTYKNSRNAVAGIMGLKDISEMLVQKAKLTLVDYRLISIKVPLEDLARRWENLKAELAELPYPMDGIVLKFADEEFRKSLGSTSHHPRGEIAYKFTNLKCQTTLTGIEWSFGKNCLTPVAQLEPVDLSGITIKRASLHNAQNIEEMQIMIGDTVTVERAGDVIPYISDCSPGLFRSSPWITGCPSCGTKLVRRGPELCCPNRDCPETILFNLLAAVRNFGIERLGEPTLRKLMEKFHITKLHEILTLTASDLMQIEGFKERSAGNLANEIAKRKQAPEANIIAALNIPNVGINIAALLLENYSISQLRTLDETTLAAIPGIGPERASAITETFTTEKEDIDRLLAVTTPLRQQAVSGDMPTICFTGKMPEKRSFYENLARERNLRPVDAVSSTLTFLVAADPASGSSKLKAAARFNVTILSLDEFLSGTPQPETVQKDAKTEPEDFSAAWDRGELF
ncbi:MAG: hypothetical protein IJY46_06965 [Lentisphaeria bacterium]|nr:hypothetical protein [Lentisphaeria bacterium]